MSIELVMPSSHLILCRPLFLLLPIPPRVFSSESTLCMRWPKYCSFSFSIIASKEIPGLISFRMDWLDLLAETWVNFWGIMLSERSLSYNIKYHTFPVCDILEIVTCKRWRTGWWLSGVGDGSRVGESGAMWGIPVIKLLRLDCGVDI